ncbi:hypothetical protein PBV52_51210 (plasmid) [Streptomyces sp. T12]|uniref:hypothetical protein n=1 Tax=Streptomyces sp. T12 TaxID=477697 RepID=UPI0023663888|nr:hypothetical protein [Streptomyces sp. T12]WDF45085.1 hypothetical protein PBV52_51210 [Streptomyces sp. T12]
MTVNPATRYPTSTVVLPDGHLYLIADLAPRTDTSRSRAILMKPSLPLYATPDEGEDGSPGEGPGPGLTR